MKSSDLKYVFLLLVAACRSNQPCLCLVPSTTTTTTTTMSTSANNDGHRHSEKTVPREADSSPLAHRPMDINFNGSRRSWIGSSLAVILSVTTVATTIAAPCQAQQEEVRAAPATIDRGGRPYAPRAALLPAARLKFVVDQMYALSTTLDKSSSSNNKNNQYQTLVQMNDVWMTRPPLIRNKEERQSRSVTAATAQLTTKVSSASKKEYQAVRQDLPLPDRVAATLLQGDVKRQLGMLQYEESKLNQGNNNMRGALAEYTSQLAFDGEAYLLTAPKLERKEMIRNDRLPSLLAVVASDLDRRDLYRNDFLTCMEDVQAEITYQLKQPQLEVDVTDVVDLMQQAHASLSKWFDCIAPIDVEDAMIVVREEQNKN